MVEPESIKEGDLFKVIAETTSTCIFITAERFIYVNPAFERITGYSLEEAKKMRFYEIVHPEHREMVKQRGLARLKGETPPKNYSFKIITKDGRTRWVDFSADRIIYQGRAAIIGTGYDITDLKETEQILRDAKKQWELTFDSISDLVSVHDRDFNIVKANRAFREFFNRPVEEIIGKKCYELFHGSKEPWPECPHVLAMKAEKPCTKEVQYKNTDKILLVTVSPVYDPEGRLIGGVHFAKDITELKRIQKEVTKKAEQLRIINTIITQAQETLDLKRFVSIVLKEVKALLGADVIKFFLKQEDTLRLTDYIGVQSPPPEEIKPGECFCGKATSERRIVFAEDMQNSPIQLLKHCKDLGMVSFISIPLVKKDSTLGVVGIGWRHRVEIKGKYEMLETLSGELALVLHNALLYERVKNHARGLEERVKERTLELQRAVNLMAGREVRMSELKETIKKLRNQLIEAGLEPVADDPLKEPPGV